MLHKVLALLLNWGMSVGISKAVTRLKPFAMAQASKIMMSGWLNQA